MRNKMLGIIILILILSSLFVGCIETSYESNSPTSTSTPYQTTTTAEPSETHTKPQTTSTPVDPVVLKAKPYLDEIVFDHKDLRKKAVFIVSDCPSGDKECQVNALYTHIVQNYKYYSDPRDEESIQSPFETIEIGGGDCEDLTILLQSFLENLGVKTYMVLTEEHAYCLACDIDTDELWPYIKESIIQQASEDLGKEGNFDVIVKNGELFLVEEEEQSFQLDGGYLYYYGGDGSEFESHIKYMDIEYEISSSQPLSIYVVPSKNDYQSLVNNEQFTHYPECEHKGILSLSDSCNGLKNYGGIVLENRKYKEANIDLNMKFYYYYSTYELLEDKEINYYNIGDQECVVLDATAGEYGYPGYDAELSGEKTAIDPLTKEYTYLK